MQKVHRACATKNGAKVDELIQPVKMDTEEYGALLKLILIFEEERVFARSAREWNIEGRRRRVIWKDYTRLREEFVVGGLMTQRGLCNIAKKRMLEERRLVQR